MLSRENVTDVIPWEGGAVRMTQKRLEGLWVCGRKWIRGGEEEEEEEEREGEGN